MIGKQRNRCKIRLMWKSTDELKYFFFPVHVSMWTSVLLTYSAHEIACACIYLAGELLSIKLSFGDEAWWEKFGASKFAIEGKNFFT